MNSKKRTRFTTHLDVALDDVERRDGGVREPAGRGPADGARRVVGGREHLDLAERRLARRPRHHHRRPRIPAAGRRRRVEEAGEQRLARRHRPGRHAGFRRCHVRTVQREVSPRLLPAGWGNAGCGAIFLTDPNARGFPGRLERLAAACARVPFYTGSSWGLTRGHDGLESKRRR